MAVSVQGAHVPQELLLLGGRWSLADPLSTRHVAELRAKRGVTVEHSPIQRWVLRSSKEDCRPLNIEFHARWTLLANGEVPRLREVFCSCWGQRCPPRATRSVRSSLLCLARTRALALPPPQTSRGPEQPARRAQAAVPTGPLCLPRSAPLGTRVEEHDWADRLPRRGHPAAAPRPLRGNMPDAPVWRARCRMASVPVAYATRALLVWPEPLSSMS
jgi:hypothetical protein